MTPRIRVGTREGLWEITGDQVFPAEALTGKSLTALAIDGAREWAIVDGRTLRERTGAAWTERATLEGPAATCLATTPSGLVIGTEEAHLLRLEERQLTPIGAFETVAGRDAWYTPWGDPADVRSISAALDGALYVNVHVGGVVRSRDGGRTWTPTVDIERDVHQVLAHPERPEVVLAAAADGLGVSGDAGASWRFVTAGLHAHYLRAVAVSGDTVLVSASTGPGGRRAALYRGRLDGDSAFERCGDGLPTWFGDNVDTGCLAARGALVVCGTEDGRVFRSLDGGRHWDVAAKGLPPITCVALP
ncbi:MAG: WD40/YVTN/BNR-like repeat-containing protein [Candidatus Rokuibacteriota bacterium]